MKKIICILLSVVISATSLSISVFADDEIKVCINGEKVEFDTEPTIINGRTFVPIRAVCEKLGADVYWWEDDEVVCIIKNDIKISLFIGYNWLEMFRCKDFEHYIDLIKNKEILETTVEMDVAPVIIDGRTLLPIRYVCEALGATVEWEATTSTVNIKCSDDVLQNPNADKSFFDKEYFRGKWPTPEILATAQTNEERIEKAIYFLELYFRTDALIHEKISSTDNLYFEIKNVAIYKLNAEYPQYYDIYDKEYKQYDGRNIDYIVEFKGATNDFSYRGGDMELYHRDEQTVENNVLDVCDCKCRVVFYKDGRCGLGTYLTNINNGSNTQFFGFPDEMQMLVQDYGTQYNQAITYPSSDGGVHIFGV